MFTSPIVLVAHGNLVPFSSYDQLRWLIWAMFGSMILNRLNEYIAYLPTGWRTGQREARAVMWMAICELSRSQTAFSPLGSIKSLTDNITLAVHSIAVARTFILPKWLGGKVAVFTSS